MQVMLYRVVKHTLLHFDPFEPLKGRARRGGRRGGGFSVHSHGPFFGPYPLLVDGPFIGPA